MSDIFSEIEKEEKKSKTQNPLTIFIGTFFGFITFQILETVLIALVIEFFFPNIFPISLFFIEMTVISFFIYAAGYYNMTKNEKFRHLQEYFGRISVNLNERKEIINNIKTDLKKIIQYNNSNTENLFFTKILSNSNNNNNDFNFYSKIIDYNIEDINIRNDLVKLYSEMKLNTSEIYMEIFLKWFAYTILVLMPFFTWGIYGWFSILANILFAFFILLTLRINVNNKLFIL